MIEIQNVDGIYRFRRNKIIADRVGDITALAIGVQEGTISREDMCEFLQLTGYSVSGYLELPWANDEERAVIHDTLRAMQDEETEQMRKALKRALNCNQCKGSGVIECHHYSLGEWWPGECGTCRGDRASLKKWANS